MSFQLQTPEQRSAANAELTKLESAAQAARSALKAFETAQSSIPAQYRKDFDGTGAKLKSEVDATRRALVAGQSTAHNESVYASLLDGYAANTARIAAEKAVQEANESEAQFKEKALQAYVSAGGTALGFAAEWQSLRAELVRQKTLTALGTQPPDWVSQYVAKRNAGR